MKLMISVRSTAEARDAIEGGAQILDVKNPEEGSLGAQSPDILREIKRLSAGRLDVSAAIGDMPNLPGTAALAALGAASCGADYIKVGVYGPRTESEAHSLLSGIRRAVAPYPVSIVAAGYADHKRTGTLAPEYLVRIAGSLDIQGFLLDTYLKDGKSVFEFCSQQHVRSLSEQCHSCSLMFGLAGALRSEDLRPAQALGADIVGLRTAVCLDGKRSGPLDPARVRELLQDHILFGL